MLRIKKALKDNWRDVKPEHTLLPALFTDKLHIYTKYNN